MNDEYKSFLDSDHPLIQRLRDKAPGTYRHAQHVEDICESIALELNLNTDLMKVVGRFHDVGKLNFPLHFSENQSSDENIHDTLSPKVSYHLITRHVPDSVMLLLQYNFPLDVIKIISEHHGDTILRQFHQNDPEAPEDSYRYQCPKPSSTESVVLMLVDSVEATSRAMFHKKRENEDSKSFVKRVVQDTIDRLDDDDQLDNIIHGTIKQIKRILIKELDTMYHKRVSYSKDEDEKEDT
jgi:hypothetical protein